MGDCGSCPVNDYHPEYSLKVNAGHVYAEAPQDAVLAALDRYLAADGMAPCALDPADHPTEMKRLRDTEARLFWVSPRIDAWTGVFEFRYYGPEPDRVGYVDELLGEALSRDLGGRVLNLEIVGSRGTWGYRLLQAGRETEAREVVETPGSPAADALEAFAREQGLANCGLGYENIPGGPTRPITGIPLLGEYVRGLSGFVHRAYRATAARLADNARMRDFVAESEAGLAPPAASFDPAGITGA